MVNFGPGWSAYDGFTGMYIAQDNCACTDTCSMANIYGAQYDGSGSNQAIVSHDGIHPTFTDGVRSPLPKCDVV
jgi:hypothetical protein